MKVPQAENPAHSQAGNARNLQVVNIFARVDFRSTFDLTKLALAVPESEYDPENTAGLILRTATPRSCITVHKSGIARCTGCRSAGDVREAVGLVAQTIRGAGFKIGEPDVEIRNVVCILDIGRAVNLELLAESARGTVDYEPEQFPAAFVRVGGKGVATVFKSGRIGFNGVRTIDQAEELGRQVLRLIVVANAWSD